MKTECLAALKIVGSNLNARRMQLKRQLESAAVIAKAIRFLFCFS